MNFQPNQCNFMTDIGYCSVSLGLKLQSKVSRMFDAKTLHIKPIERKQSILGALLQLKKYKRAYSE